MATYTVAGPDRFTQHLAGVNLIGQDLTATNYVGADLRGAKLDFCTLTGADFTNADLTNASLQYATLANCTFTGADLTGADLKGANLYGTAILSDHYGGAVPQYYFHQAILDTVPVNVEPFPTEPVAGYIVWFAADMLVGLSDAAAVTQLTDQSTNGNDAVQATEAKQGVYKTGIVNGKAVVRFDGTNTWYETVGTVDSATIFVVFNHNESGSTFPDYRRILDGGDQIGWSFLGDTSAATYNVLSRNIDALAAMWVNGALSNSALAPDLATFRIVSANITIPATQRLSVGTYGGTGGQPFSGDMAEYLIYPTTALSGTDRKKVESYLSHKYGITVTA